MATTYIKKEYRMRLLSVPLSTCLTLILLTVLPLVAQIDSVFSLGAVVVTGKAKKEINNTVSAADIAKYAKPDVAKALNLLPGVTLSQMGARNEGGVYVRGFDSRQVALFMDGIPFKIGRAH